MAKRLCKRGNAFEYLGVIAAVSVCCLTVSVILYGEGGSNLLAIVRERASKRYEQVLFVHFPKMWQNRNPNNYCGL